MTPHPLATWVQMTVSPQRHAIQARRRRRTVRLLLARRDRRRVDPSEVPAATPQPVPEQRRRLALPPVRP